MKNEVKEIFKSSVVTVWYDDLFKLAYLIWDCKGGLSFEKYKEPFEFLIENTGISVLGVLSDSRNQGIIGTKMRSWLQKDGAPRAKQRGLKCHYVVTDANSTKVYYVNIIIRLLEGDGLDRKLFRNFDEADQSIKTAISKFV